MASLGVVSAVGGPLRFRGGASLDRYVQADVAMLPGFSGGPLVDSVGNLIGLNSSSLGRAGQLTVLAATIDATVATLLQHGRVRRGYLGVGAQGVRLPETLVRALDNGQELGLLIVSVEAGGPADTAGLMLVDHPGRRRHGGRPGRATSGATFRGSRWQEHPDPHRPRRRTT